MSTVSGASDVVAGALYPPYYLSLFALCGVIVFAMPNSWQLTARLSWPRVAFVTSAMALATLMMWTQTINPFLYFQF
jgi:alginate O-acetyltransferase complex protein AlgI